MLFHFMSMLLLYYLKKQVCFVSQVNVLKWLMKYTYFLRISFKFMLGHKLLHINWNVKQNIS